jgi:NSS family neurotransmitter:Na+ symporter
MRAEPAPIAPEHWASRLGVILAVSGSAVGLGNFLRFPGLAAKYGGGAFLIPYFVAILLLGIPICWAEWTIGRYGGRLGHNSAPGILGAVTGWRHGHLLGVLALLVPLIVYMYYVYIEAWCLAYAWYYATGTLPLGRDAAAYGAFFDGLVGTNENGLVTAGGLQPAFVALVVVSALNFVLIYRGLNRGVEAFCKVAMPLLILSAIIVLLRVLTLGTPDPAFPERNVLNGLGFMWNPKVPPGQTLLGVLADAEIWLQAAGQVFFSLSIGFGIIITYASYLRERDDLVLSGLTASSTNEFCEVCLGGLITVPAAFIFLGAEPIQQVAGSTFGLGFYTLPVIFEHMPLGALFGFLWFLLLFLAAVTSSLSMLQPVIAFLEEGLGMERRASVAVLGLVTALGSLLVVYFSRNLVALDVMDFWVGQVGIFLLATLIVIVFAWVIGVERGIAEAERGALLRLPPGFRFVIKYVSPTYLLVVFAFFLVQNAGAYTEKLFAEPPAALTAFFIVTVTIFLTVMVHTAGRRWQARASGREPR